MAFSYSPKIVTDGLVLYLDAANPRSYPGTGTVWTDLSGNGNNGTLTNGPTFNTDNLGNVVLDGVDDFIQISNPSLGQSFTFDIIFKVKPFDGITDTNGLIGVGNPFNLNGNGIHLRQGTNTTEDGLALVVHDGNPVYSNVVQNFVLPINLAWKDNFFNNAVVAINNQLTADVYLNGNHLGTRSINKTFGLINTQNLRIGRYAATIYTNGSAASVKVYNRVLSASEVQQNYNATKTRYGLL